VPAKEAHKIMQAMKTYVVGGAVRDGLLGLPVQDRDHVVVGATPQDMLRQGFTPVGKDFPVFLHPKTHEEYALARTERKTAPGYKGFVFHAAPGVTLEEDLIRRDLTINAMARAEDGSLVDPFGGQRDLQAKLFRHVSPAFAEDPLRILRVARFAARFADFRVAEETNALMRRMVQSGEVDALVPERVWQELARGLLEAKPSRMFEVLRACGALQRILPELEALWGVPQPENHSSEIDTGAHVMMAIDFAATMNHTLPIRFAVLTQELGKEAAPPPEWLRDRRHGARSVKLVEAVCKRLKIPNECRDLAVMAAREHGNIGRAFEWGADTIVSLLERCDAFRKPQRFLDMLKVAECSRRGHTGFEKTPLPQAAYLEAALAAAQTVDAGAIAKMTQQRFPAQPEQIAAAIHAARVKAVSGIDSQKENLKQP
jgi:tRNA nucleotidyltransferase (CCA-adding enzyme)